jgi:hypothetical protein
MERKYEPPHSVWKPCRLPVRDWPLAVCDATSVDLADLVPTDIIYPNYVAENCMVHFNENQKWYWLPDQEADEVLVFKAVDSDDPNSWRESPPSPLRCLSAYGAAHTKRVLMAHFLSQDKTRLLHLERVSTCGCWLCMQTWFIQRPSLARIS